MTVPIPRGPAWRLACCLLTERCRYSFALIPRLRGVPELHVQPLVAQLLRRVGLEGAAEALCGAYR